MSKVFDTLNIAILILTTPIASISQDINYMLLIDSYNINKQYDSIIHLTDSLNSTKYDNIKADAYYFKGDFAQALKIYKTINNNDPKDANYQISQCYGNNGIADSAIIFLGKYLNTKNKELKSYVRTNKAFVNIENDSIWQNFWISDRYSKYELLLNDADFEYRNDNFESAIEILDAITDKRESMHEAYKLYANIYKKLDDYKTVLYYANKASKLKPRIAEYHYLKAEALINLSKYRKAKDAINETMDIDSSKVCFYMARGRIYLSNNEYEKATHDFELLKTMYSSDSLYYLTALNYFNSGDYLNCLRNINLCINNDNTKIYYYYLRAKTYFETECYKFAADDYEYISKKEPSNFKVYSYLAECYLNMNNIDKACSYWHEADKYGNMQSNEYILKYCK